MSHPLERALLSHCSANRTMKDLIADSRLKAAIEEYAEPLRDAALAADEAEYARGGRHSSLSRCRCRRSP